MENLNYANYVITSITEADFFTKNLNYANYGGKFFPKKFELRNYVGSEKFFGQKPQLRNYVITQLQKCQNHPFVLPYLPEMPPIMSAIKF